MATYDVHGYVQMEGSSTDEVPGRKRRVWAVCCGFVSAAFVVVLCNTIPGGWSPSSASHEPTVMYKDQSRVNLAGIMHGGPQKLGFLPTLHSGGQRGDQYIPRASSKDEAWRAQQEILARRRNKDANAQYMNDVSNRRQKAQEDFWAKRIKYKEGKDNLEQWKKLNPEPYNPKKKYSEEPEGFSIPIPLNPIGMPKFDNGERFDLKLPYVDNGYVAEDSTDAFSRFKGLLDFSFGGKKAAEKKAAAEAAKKAEAEAAAQAAKKNKGWFR